MAIMASNGPVDAEGAFAHVSCSSRERSVAPPRRSPAEEVEDWVDWIWEAEYIPRTAIGSSL